MMTAYSKGVAALTMLSLVIGCEGNSLGIRSGSSLLVEVGVYKGPLATPKDIQEGELEAVLWQALASFYNFRQGIDTQYGVYYSSKKKKNVCPPSKINEYCLFFYDEASFIIDSLCDAIDYVETKPPLDSGDGSPRTLRSQTLCKSSSGSDFIKPDDWRGGLAELAGHLRSLAFRSHYDLVSRVPEDREIRKNYADLSNISAEFANQIQSRNNVLAKQKQNGGRNANLLSMSDYLRDTSPTDFLYLYDWYNATGKPSPDFPLHLNRGERIRAAQGLFDDYYWENINEVFANGQGTVRMALVKDAIGNWDLKTFSNAPGELLDAYRGAAESLVKGAVDAIKASSTGGLSEGAAFLQLADLALTGQSPGSATLAGLDVSALHARTVEKMEVSKIQAVNRLNSLVAERDEAQQKVDTASTEIENLKAEKGTLEGEIAELNNEIEMCSNNEPPCADEQKLKKERTDARNEIMDLDKKIADQEIEHKKLQKAVSAKNEEINKSKELTIQEVRSILDDHRAVIAALEEAVASSAAPTTQPTSTLQNVRNTAGAVAGAADAQ